MAYLSGDGVPKDSLKAVQWLKVAESQNFAGTITLGVLLLEGQESVEKNNGRIVFLEKQQHRIINWQKDIWKKGWKTNRS